MRREKLKIIQAFQFLSFFLVLLVFALDLVAKEKNKKGLLPEITANTGVESEDNKRSAKSENLIAKSEITALKKLDKLIQKYKGGPEEPDLLFRKADLHMRRSKGGRFFELFKDDKKIMSLLPRFPVDGSKTEILKAIAVYEDLEKRFPKFYQMDQVIFNNAFARTQLGHSLVALELYDKIIKGYRDSPFFIQAHLASADLKYDLQRFAEALTHYDVVASVKNSKLRNFALYKSAWTLYNMKQTELSLNKIEELLASQKKEAGPSANKLNLRTEAIRDFALFVSEVKKSGEAYNYFAKHLELDEVGDAVMTLAKIYNSHSRFEDLKNIVHDFDDENPLHSRVVEAHLLLVDALETQKKRDELVIHFEKVFKLCSENSNWRKMNKESELVELCDLHVQQKALDFSKKWWEYWNKNRENKTYVKWTEDLLALQIRYENKTKTNPQLHFAYAEILFLQKKYAQCAPHYEIVWQNTVDSKLKHDSLYAAIVSYNKQEDKNSKTKAHLFSLLESYLKENPKGTYLSEVKFQRGFMLYEQKDFIKAKVDFSELLSIKEVELREKSEDLYLDILNAEKDYELLSKRAMVAAKKASHPDRTKKLKELAQSAELKSIEVLEQNAADAIILALRYQDFFEKNKDSVLAEEALYRAIDWRFKGGDIFSGAELGQTFLRYYASNKYKKKEEITKEAKAGVIRPKEVEEQPVQSLDPKRPEKIKKLEERMADAYIQTGYLDKAALVYQALAAKEAEKVRRQELLNLSMDLHMVHGDVEKAKEVLKELYPLEDSQKSNENLIKQMAFFKKLNLDPDYKRLKQLAVQKKIEPIYSESLVQDLEEKLKAKTAKNEPVIFETALRILKSDAPSEVKAKAKLIQAGILENELIRQSMKAKIDRLATVIALKTERLDKATEAYTSVLKLSDQYEIQKSALEGLKRSFENYVFSLRQMPIPLEVPPSDANELLNELEKLVIPIEDKYNDISVRLAKLEGEDSEHLKKASSLSKTPTPDIDYPSLLRNYLPYWPEPKRWILVDQLASASCQEKTLVPELSYDSLAENINKCVKAKKWPQVELGASILRKKDFTKPWGAFYSYVSARELGKSLRAEWFLNLALSRLKPKKDGEIDPVRALFLHELSVITWKSGGADKDAYKLLNQAAALFDPSLDQKHVFGLKAWQNGKCEESVKLLNSLSGTDRFETEAVAFALSDCYAILSKKSEALSVLDKALKQKQNPMLLLKKAFLQETELKQLAEAILTYKKAAPLLTKEEDKIWLNEKLEKLNLDTAKTKNEEGKKPASIEEIK